MHSIARLITLPFLFGTFTSFATAEAVSPEQATELLVKSQVLDAKCNFLTAAENRTLSNLAARAEIALATQQSVSKASAALARGKVKGKSASCSDVEKAEVLGILNAAQLASAQAAQLASTHAAQEPQPIALAEPQPAKVTPVEPIDLAPVAPKKRIIPSFTNKIAVKKLIAKDAKSLSDYASLTQRYYLQRRCANMSSKAMGAFYQTVVTTHKNTLQTFGRASTAAAMRRAEAQAATQTCS